PDISSVSYSSNGKILNSSIWLTGPSEGLSSNKTRAYSSSIFVNDRPVSQATYFIDIADVQNKTLNKVVSELLKNYRGNYTSFKLLGGRPFAGGHAYTLSYSFDDRTPSSNCPHCMEFDILGIKGGRLYTIGYQADPKVFPKFVKTALDMTRSINIDTDALKVNKNIAKETLTYENSTYRVKMQYPSNWLMHQHNTFSPKSKFTKIVSFNPKNSSDVSIRMVLDSSPKDPNNYLNETISAYKKLTDFNLIESKY